MGLNFPGGKKSLRKVQVLSEANHQLITQASSFQASVPLTKASLEGVSVPLRPFVQSLSRKSQKNHQVPTSSGRWGPRVSRPSLPPTSPKPWATLFT